MSGIMEIYFVFTLFISIFGDGIGKLKKQEREASNGAEGSEK
jgi:hypothetical protein